MRYRAGCDCTDFDGVFYSRDQEAELDGAVIHSVHLVPLETPALIPAQSEVSAPAAAPKAKTTARKKTKEAEA